MDSNKDEALRCIAIAQRRKEGGDLSSARRFCEKSLALFPTPEASKLLENIIQMDESVPGTSSENHSATTAESHPSAQGLHHRSSRKETTSYSETDRSSSAKHREYTTEQASIVKRVRSCKATDYYGMLSLKRDCEEVEVKKAYRKLALQLHPDKNSAPGADEAFKMVSKAFQILSDSEKRAMYDRNGSDPESRFGDSMAGFSRRTASTGFQEELSPEDLFNMFFGNAAFGGESPFSNSGVYTASFGPNGFRTSRMFSGNHHANGGRRQDETTIKGLFTQLTPLLILFLFTLLSALPSLYSGSNTRNPRFSFTPSTWFDLPRETSEFNIKYFVNEKEFNAHPIGGEVTQAETSGRRSNLLKTFDRQIEQSYKEHVFMLCQRDLDRQQRRKEQKMGFLGIGTDWDAIRMINEEKLDSCEEYKRVTAHT